MKGRKDGASLGKHLHVIVFIVRRALLPAAKEDADPFEGQGANDRVVFFTFGGVVGDIVAGPLALGNRKASKFVEGLPVKLGAGLTEIGHAAAAAASSDRSDSGKALSVLCSLITGTIGAKESQEPRRHGRAGAGHLVKEGRLGMLVKELFNALFVLVDDRIEGLDHSQVHESQAAATFGDRRVGG